MPIVDRDYKSNWDLCYGAKFRRPIVLPATKRTSRLLKNVHGKTLFLYCGYAYTYECLTAQVGETLLVDPSLAIQGLKNLEDEVDSSDYCVVPHLIENLDITNAIDRDAIRDAGPFDSIIIDYPTMNWLTNAENRQLIDEAQNNLLAAEGTIYVIVKVLYEAQILDPDAPDGPDDEPVVIGTELSVPGRGLAGWNWKSLEDWQTRFPGVEVIPFGGNS